MSDDLVKRARDAHENSPQRIAGSNIFAELVDRIEALERENRLYRIMVEDCDRQRKTQYARANAAEAALATMTQERTRLHTQCDGLMQSAMNNGQALIIAEARLAKAVEALREIEWSNDSKWQADCARDTLAEMGEADDDGR